MRSVASALQQGLPVLAGQFLIAVVLVGLGMAVYMLATPFDDRRLVREGNVAGGVVLAGSLLAFTLPIAATLATSRATLDILVWGLVALAVQMLTFFATTFFLRDLRAQLESGNTAAALVLAAIQLSISLLNAAAMAG